MIAVKNMCEADKLDAELVADSLAGDRSAFSEIVSRYQRTIAGLAYSATGSLSRSEDLAQEIFVRAWKELPRLREPAKLRPWLCTIARFMISKAHRREHLEPVHSAEALESAPELPAIEPLPSEGAINREEETILWRSLEKIPELYREPLVLFYREHQSIRSVAVALDLTEDAVKQRLARGRKLLHREVLLFVETTLERTNPGPALGLAVMSTIALGTSSAKAAAAGTLAFTGKASAASKGICALARFGIITVFAAAIGGQIAAVWGRVRSGRSPRERRFLAQSSLGFAGWKLLLLLSLLALMALQGGDLIINNVRDALPWMTLWIALLGIWVAYSVWMVRRQNAIRLAEGSSTDMHGAKLDYAAKERTALTARSYGSLAAWIFGPGGFLVWLTHSKGNDILSGLLFALAIVAWLVGARVCLRHPHKIQRVFSAVLFGQALIIMLVINLLWPSWAGLNNTSHFAPPAVNFIILVFYGSLASAQWLHTRLTRSA